jgi:hypothetical protein
MMRIISVVLFGALFTKYSESSRMSSLGVTFLLDFRCSPGCDSLSLIVLSPIFVYSRYEQQTRERQEQRPA